MGKLIYIANMSVDGYLEDEEGRFDWTEPDEELFAFFNDLIRPIGTYLYGRRMYETMAVWETDPSLAAQSELMSAFADAWQAAEKVVYSTTLAEVPTRRTRVERSFDPAAVAALKDAAAADLSIGGPEVTAHALNAGLVDECHLIVHPVVVGGGKPAVPKGTRAHLELLDERRMKQGYVYLRYGVRS